MTDYDIIIVGGRPAGSTLAARLSGVRVLLLERDTLPSPPAVSSPVIYSPTMRLLDEIGADERIYANNTPKLKEWVIQAAGYWQVSQRVPAIHGRDYAYAIDRARFDHTLWKIAAAQPNVTAHMGASVIGLIHDDGRVGGVRVRDRKTGSTSDYTARLVVGADGRFSTVARKTGAKQHQQHDTQPTTAYYAYWEQVEPLAAPAMQLISTGGDYGLLLMDSADGRVVVVIEGRADVIQPESDESVNDFYCRWLQKHPDAWARLAHARQITTVKGMRNIGNCYRTVGGAGWVLVGDALHQKDPLDGQGIYDAVFMAKALSRAIQAWQLGQDWESALMDYEQAVYAETYPMYRATLARVHREIYTQRPAWFMKYPARWLYMDREYRERWARLFVRDIAPEDWYSYRVVIGALLRGMWQEVRSI